MQRRRKHKKWQQPDNTGKKYKKRQKEAILHDELVGMVAAYSNYAKYEVEDIFHFLAIAISEEIKKGNRVRLKGVGWFKTKKPYTRTFYSAMIEEKVKVTTKITPMLSGDNYMINYLNSDSTEELDNEEEEQYDEDFE